MVRCSIVFSGVFVGVLAVAAGCSVHGSGGASKARGSRPAPAAVDLRVAERFAVHHLGPIDELTCVMKRAANGHALPGDEVSCTALQINNSKMEGISFHCTTMGTRSPEPACRLSASRPASPEGVPDP